MHRVVVEVLEGTIPPPILGNTIISTSPCYLDEYQFSIPMDQANDLTNSGKILTGENEIVFYAGNPTVESIKGILHLCKGTNERFIQVTENHESTFEPCEMTAIPEKRSDLVCVLSIPRWMPMNEFCNWMRKFEGAEQMRVIKPSNPEYYMVIIKFKSQHHTDAFYMQANSQPFNSVEPECCYIVYVESCRFIEPTTEILFPVNGELKELPSCPVCLERLDSEESGLITSICNHVFHSNCISQWQLESTCPVCRYQLQSEAKNKCSDCEASEDLWICLLCGNIGCSRYKNEHAELHFQKTGHTYSLEIDTQRVWDYAGDGYVHRLIQNKTDGKIVELPDPSHSTMTRSAKKDPSKLDALVVEYNYLLTTQLESQRLFFEQREGKKDEYIKSLEEKLKSNPDKAPPGSKANVKLNNRINLLQTENNKLKKEIDFVQEINKNLIENQNKWEERFRLKEKEWEDRFKTKEDEIQELKGQVRDLMLHLDNSQSIAGSELVDGSVVVTQTDVPPARGIRKKRAVCHFCPILEKRGTTNGDFACIVIGMISSTTSRIKRRDHLDGLRGVAISLIILYHSGFVYFSNGYSGIDILFVISGFLISAILFAEIQHSKKIDFLQFYARRVKRVIPVSLMTLIGSAMIFKMVSSTAELVKNKNSFIAASLMVENWQLLISSEFSETSNSWGSPVAHFWSVNAGEQFYVIWPFLLSFLYKLSKFNNDSIMKMICTLIICLISLNSILTSFDPVFVYMSTISRSYQMLSGALTALILIQFEAKEKLQEFPGRNTELVGTLLNWSGFLFLVFSPTYFTKLSTTAVGIMYCTTTCLLIVGLELSSAHCFIKRLLVSRVLRKLGRLSFSIYMFHFPLLILAKIVGFLPFRGDPTCVWQTFHSSLPKTHSLLRCFGYSFHFRPFAVRVPRSASPSWYSSFCQGSTASCNSHSLFLSLSLFHSSSPSSLSSSSLSDSSSIVPPAPFLSDSSPSPSPSASISSEDIPSGSSTPTTPFQSPTFGHSSIEPQSTSPVAHSVRPGLPSPPFISTHTSPSIPIATSSAISTNVPSTLSAPVTPTPTFVPIIPPISNSLNTLKHSPVLQTSRTHSILTAASPSSSSIPFISFSGSASPTYSLTASNPAGSASASFIPIIRPHANSTMQPTIKAVTPSRNAINKPTVTKGRKENEEKPAIMFAGDSYVWEWTGAMNSLSRKHNFVYKELYASNCTWFPLDSEPSANCTSLHARINDTLLHTRIHLSILWLYYIEEYVREGLQLLLNHSNHVAVLLSHKNPKGDYRECLQLHLTEKCESEAVYAKGQKEVNDLMVKLSKEFKYTVVSIDSIVCPNDVCPGIVNRTIAFIDPQHLAQNYAQQYLAYPFYERFKESGIDFASLDSL